ncbi:hypothetical protein EVAR_74946_1 [Eumeta japonica]|uniref:Uncharacterized protein n=1 Tax=Eumeta variegata TaxID=151549 RepID=A0A4C1UJW5_EUMVA|nr:hypothetical protein EVAR_74946_1 [Eumeta japonica]
MVEICSGRHGCGTKICQFALEIPHSECWREVSTPAVIYRPVSERSRGRLLFHHIACFSLEIGNALVSRLGLKVSMGSDSYGRTNGATSPSSSRPTVDSLLDQLSTDLHNG